MTNHQVLEQDQKLVWELRETTSLLLQHGQSDADVADQRSLDRVSESPVVCELVDLPDVVQDGAGDQQIAVDPEIAYSDELTQGAEGNSVLEKTAQIGVVQRLGGGR